MQAGRADRAGRDPQRRRADVARRVDDPRGHRAGRRAPAGARPTAGRSRSWTSTSRRSATCYVDTLAHWGGPARGRPVRRGHDGTAPGRVAAAAGLGHRARDEPARDGDVARRDGRPAAALQRHAAGAARPGAGLGPAASARTSGRRGWCPGCGSGWSSPRSGVGAPDLGDRRGPGPGAAPLAGCGCRLPARCASCSTSCRSSRAAPFDRDRPLWRALLVEGLEGGGAGYVVTTHHSATDGLGAVQLMGRLHSRTRRARPRSSGAPVPRPRATASPVGLLADQVGRTARAVPGEALRPGAGMLGSADPARGRRPRTSWTRRGRSGRAVAPAADRLTAARERAAATGTSRCSTCRSTS